MENFAEVSYFKTLLRSCCVGEIDQKRLVTHCIIILVVYCYSPATFFKVLIIRGFEGFEYRTGNKISAGYRSIYMSRVFVLCDHDILHYNCTFSCW